VENDMKNQEPRYTAFYTTPDGEAGEVMTLETAESVRFYRNCSDAMAGLDNAVERVWIVTFLGTGDGPNADFPLPFAIEAYRECRSSLTPTEAEVWSLFSSGMIPELVGSFLGMYTASVRRIITRVHTKQLDIDGSRYAKLGNQIRDCGDLLPDSSAYKYWSTVATPAFEPLSRV
jgi:hypothetical protein